METQESLNPCCNGIWSQTHIMEFTIYVASDMS